jgi:putative heme transporter
VTAVSDPPRRARSRRRVLFGAGGLLLVVLTFAFVLPRIADYRDVWAVIKTLSWEWALALAGATILNIVTFAPPWMVALPGLGFRQALAMTQASTALTYVVPGGAAVGIAGSFGLLRSWGFSSAAVGGAVTLTGIWNQFANFSFPIVALFLLTVSGQPGGLLVTAAFVGVAALGVAVAGLVLALWSAKLAHDLGDAASSGASWARAKFRRGPVGPWGDAFARFRGDTVGLLRRRWHVLTLTTVVGQLTVFLVLVLCLRAFEVPTAQVTLIEAFAGWSLARLLTIVPLTPGGLGTVELGLTAALVGFGGANAPVVAAVLVYRFLTVVPTLCLGLLAVATWRRHRPRSTATTGP